MTAVHREDPDMCMSCNGTGEQDGYTCTVCGGNGYVIDRGNDDAAAAWCRECGGTGQRDGEECRFCNGDGFESESSPFGADQ